MHIDVRVLLGNARARIDGGTFVVECRDRSDAADRVSLQRWLAYNGRPGLGWLGVTPCRDGYAVVYDPCDGGQKTTEGYIRELKYPCSTCRTMLGDPNECHRCVPTTVVASVPRKPKCCGGNCLNNGSHIGADGVGYIGYPEY